MIALASFFSHSSFLNTFSLDPHSGQVWIFLTTKTICRVQMEFIRPIPSTFETLRQPQEPGKHDRGSCAKNLLYYIDLLGLTVQHVKLWVEGYSLVWSQLLYLIEIYRVHMSTKTTSMIRPYAMFNLLHLLSGRSARIVVAQ